MFSGFGGHTTCRERALATGADGYLQKGMSLKRIVDYVRGIVDGSVDGTVDPSTPSRPRCCDVVHRRV